MRPLEDKILVRPDGPVKKVGSVVIPDTVVERPNSGRVSAVGGGIPDYPMILKPGDLVYYARTTGTEIEVKGEKLIIMRQSDVLLYDRRD